jgi:hypothetical protein
VKAPSDDILGINAMLADTDDEVEDKKGKLTDDEEGDEFEAKWSSEVVFREHTFNLFQLRKHFQPSCSTVVYNYELFAVQDMINFPARLVG